MAIVSPPGRDGIVDPHIITVGGGKGGTGRSVIAANLAVALAEAGSRVVVVDAELGGGTQRVLFGATGASPGIAALVDGRVSDPDEIAIATELPNLRLIGADAQPLAGQKALDSDGSTRLERQLRRLNADMVVIDASGGYGTPSLQLFNMGDVRLAVSTPQLTSVKSTFTFLRAAVIDALSRCGRDANETETIAQALNGEGVTPIATIIDVIAQQRPDLAELLRATLMAYDVRLIGSQLRSEDDTGIFRGACRMVRDLLGVNFPHVGSLSLNRNIHESVNRRRPFLLSGHMDDDEMTLHNVAATLQRNAPRPRVRTPSGDGVDVGSPELLLRRHRRISVDWDAVLREANGEQMAAARVLDISEGGAAIQTRRVLKPGQQWTLVIDRPSFNVNVPTEVRYVNAPAARAGLTFLADAATCGRIVEFAELGSHAATLH